MVARHHDADIAIIGGGPAGAAAAITCARRGHAVILLERDVAFTERPGETMHPGVGSILTQLGFGDQLDQIATGLHTGIWIEWGSTPRFEPYGSDESGPWRGFHLWRPSFDTALLDLAKTAGAAIHKGVSVTGLSAMNGQIERINTREGDVTARIVIDASGRSSHMARQLGVQYQARSPALIARYGYVTGSCPRRDDAPKISGDRDGWTWTAKIHDGLYQWTRVDFTAIARDDWLPDEFTDMTRMHRTRGADVTWRIAQEPAGGNWFMAGDAAALLDPSSSRGVLKALMTGMMSGHLADASLRGTLSPSRAASSYCRWLGDWFERDVIHMERFYHLLNTAPSHAPLTSHDP